jgi:hypothetical protein
LRQAYDYWQNQPDNTFVRHSRGARAAGADGSRGAHPPRGVEGRYQEGAHEAPGRRGAPGVPGVTRAAIQLPPLSPSAPVRTQWFPPGRPGGRWRAAAYGPRVEGPDPVDNAGERRIPRGGSPQESGFRCGQRPSVHRLQRCRRPKGPRASGATATPAPGPKPRRGTPRQQRITHGGWCRAQGASTHQTPEGDPSGREGYHCRRAHEVTRQQW